MNAYQQLRERAKSQRNESIREAHSLYKQTIKRIELLERSMGIPKRQPVTPEPEQRRIMDLIVEVMPKDRPFQMVEVAELLRDQYPERDFKTLTIKQYFQVLAVRGELRRVCKPTGRHVTWAAKDCPADAPLDGIAALVHVAANILEERGPMKLMDLTLAIQQRGTRPEASPRSLMESLRRTLCHNQGRFAKDEDGRWSVSDSTRR